jgi:hypothetical protein
MPSSSAQSPPIRGRVAYRHRRRPGRLPLPKELGSPLAVAQTLWRSGAAAARARGRGGRARRSMIAAAPGPWLGAPGGGWHRGAARDFHVERIVAAARTRSRRRYRPRQLQRVGAGTAECRSGSAASPSRGTGAFAQEILRLALAEPEAQRADRVIDPARPNLALGIDQHLGQRLARQHYSSRAIERPEARDQPRLDRERPRAALAEAVDRLDAQCRRRARRAPWRTGSAPFRSAPAVPVRPAHPDRRTDRSSARTQRRAAGDAPDISAAPALVKVRHRIAPGSTPAQQQPEHARASTCVLPVPAEADSQTCASGSLARP